jgi:tRNA (cmo5U34)-methyltransferase
MNPDELKELFDQQAAGYDSQWTKTVPIQNCVYLLVGSFFADLPADARILCVGVGQVQSVLFMPGCQNGQVSAGITEFQLRTL